MKLIVTLRSLGRRWIALGLAIAGLLLAVELRVIHRETGVQLPAPGKNLPSSSVPPAAVAGARFA